MIGRRSWQQTRPNLVRTRVPFPNRVGQCEPSPARLQQNRCTCHLPSCCLLLPPSLRPGSPSQHLPLELSPCCARTPAGLRVAASNEPMTRYRNGGRPRTEPPPPPPEKHQHPNERQSFETHCHPPRPRPGSRWRQSGWPFVASAWSASLPSIPLALSMFARLPTHLLRHY